MTPPTGDVRPDHSTRYFRNSVYLALSKASVAFTFVAFIAGARILGDSAFGDFTLALAIASILVLLSAWGTNRLSSITAARDPDRIPEFVARNLGLSLILAVVYLVAVGTVGALVAGPTVVAAALLLGGDLLLVGFGSLLRLMFRVRDVYALEAVTATAERFAVAAGALGALWIEPTPISFAAGFLGGRLLGAAVTAVLFVRRIGPIRVRFEPEGVRRLLSGGTPLAIRSLLASINLRVDKLLLGIMRASREVGWYGAVSKLMEGVTLFPAVILGSLAPSLSASHAAGERDVIERLTRRGFKYLLVAGIFVGGVSMALSEPIVLLVYGREYGPAVPALRVLALAVPLTFSRYLAVEVMDNMDRRTGSAVVVGLGAALNVGLNLVLIPRHGILGAAAATVASEALFTAGLYWLLARGGVVATDLASILRVLAGGLPLAGALLLLRDHPAAALLVGTTAYALGLTLAGAWDSKDWRLARDVLRRLGAPVREPDATD